VLFGIARRTFASLPIGFSSSQCMHAFAGSEVGFGMEGTHMAQASGRRP